MATQFLSRRAFLMAATGLASATLVWTCAGPRSARRSTIAEFANYVDRDGWMLTPADAKFPTAKTPVPPGRP